MGAGKDQNHYAGFHRRPDWAYAEFMFRLHHDGTKKLDIEVFIPISRARLLASAAVTDSQFDGLFLQAVAHSPDFIAALHASPSSVAVFRQLLLDAAAF